MGSLIQARTIQKSCAAVRGAAVRCGTVLGAHGRESFSRRFLFLSWTVHRRVGISLAHPPADGAFRIDLVLPPGPSGDSEGPLPRFPRCRRKSALERGIFLATRASGGLGGVHSSNHSVAPAGTFPLRAYLLSVDTGGQGWRTVCAPVSAGTFRRRAMPVSLSSLSSLSSPQ